MCADVQDKNVLGTALELCCTDPVTGFYRNGFCQTGDSDVGTHVTCARMTDEFLTFSLSRGNDLITPRPEYNFPGLKAGDQWCLCAARWMEALEAGVAPPILLDATHEKMLEYTDLDTLKKQALVEGISAANDNNAHAFSFISIDGAPMPLADYKGGVVLIVNTASQCGFTGQYKDLQMIYEEYREQGLTVIGVPCNQFGSQEPDPESSIADFVSQQFGITFPLTSKVSVKGSDSHPFFDWASGQKKGGFLFSSPKWNFHKFLIDQDGNLVGSFGSQVNPASDTIRSEIERLLALN